ncbi:hypothetical protein [Portibacter marinus]
MDVRNYSAGTYFLNVVTDHEIATRKVIIAG